MATIAGTFPVLFLIARPAAGKSEIIDYLKGSVEEVRRTRFHIGPFTEIDDFPLIWSWFEEDELLERMGQPRLHSDEAGYFRFPYLWHILIERLGLEYAKLRRDTDSQATERTVIVEFARGTEHGGYQEAFQHVPVEMLERAAILYVNVSWAESLRKNRARANSARPDSVLEHSLSDEKMARLYRESDWPAFSAADPDFVTIHDRRVPYAVFENEDDVTTERGQALGDRLQATMGHLWSIYEAFHNNP